MAPLVRIDNAPFFLQTRFAEGVIRVYDKLLTILPPVAGCQYKLNLMEWREYKNLMMVISRTEVENKDYLIQIVETGHEADFKKGLIQTVTPENSKDVSRVKAFVGISIGGKGGTYEILQYARTHNFPFIPLPHTGGDSVRAYNELTNESGFGNAAVDLLLLRTPQIADRDSYLQALQSILNQLNDNTKENQSDLPA